MPHTWDPERYLTYADERGRPFVELVARVGAAAPASVVDLGCGPGNLTTLLRARWPEADDPRTRLEPGDDREGASRSTPRSTSRSPTCATGRATADPVDVLVSNATLQWIPGHLDLLPALVSRVRPGGWFAFQVPGNFGEPSHTIRTDLAAEAPYAEHTRGRRRPEQPRPGGLPRGPRDPRLPRRRLGDDVPPRAQRPRPGLHLGVRHRRAADPSGAARRPAAAISRTSSGDACVRRTPSATAASCCPSDGSSSWQKCPEHDRAAPCAGLLPAGQRGCRAPLLRRRPRAHRGRQARRTSAGGAAPGSGRTTCAAASARSSTSASRTLSCRLARPTRRSWWTTSTRSPVRSRPPVATSTGASATRSRATAGSTSATPTATGSRCSSRSRTESREPPHSATLAP